jgi:hypothetical protein
MVKAQVYVQENVFHYNDDGIEFKEEVQRWEEIIVDFADESTIRFQNRARIAPPHTYEWKVDVVVPPCNAATIYLANEEYDYDIYESESKVVSIDILRENGHAQTFMFK